MTRMTQVLIAAALASLACARPVPTSDRPASGGVIVDRAEIAASGARNALEAVERATTHLTIQRTRNGSPVRITHRGVDSLILDPQVMVVVDGSPVRAIVEQLENIPAETIDYLQILNGREATMRFGSGAGNGAIVVRTSARREVVDPG